MKLLLILCSCVFLQACTTASISRDVPVPLDASQVDTVHVPPGSRLRCQGPVPKPKSRLVKNVLVAWQMDRNRLRECLRRNDQKIEVIDKLVSDFIG